MNSVGRYELKFVLDEIRFHEMLAWLHTNMNLREEYPVRIVNSLYFDDINFQSMRDNLSGIPDRKKRRLRWYNDFQSRNVVNPVLEIKSRKGRLVYKDACPLPELKDKLLIVESRSIVNSINNILYAKESPLGVLDDHMNPVLLVNYERQYCNDVEGLRVTIDRNITFNYVMPYHCLSDCPAYLYPNSVIEFKFPVELKNYVSTLIRYSNLQPKRHSKYLTGLAAFGLVTYL
jgi:hypothetical protein